MRNPRMSPHERRLIFVRDLFEIVSKNPIYYPEIFEEDVALRGVTRRLMLGHYTTDSTAEEIMRSRPGSYPANVLRIHETPGESTILTVQEAVDDATNMPGAFTILFGKRSDNRIIDNRVVWEVQRSALTGQPLDIANLPKIQDFFKN